MPTHKVKGGYKWGKSGKVYPTKKQADAQGRAIYANGWGENESIELKTNPLNEKSDDYLYKIISETLNELYGNIEEGIDFDNKTLLVSYNPSHEKNVDTSIENNPTYDTNIIPNIKVWSIFKRKRGMRGDGNPLVYALKGEGGWRFRSNKDKEAVLEQFDKIATKFASLYPIGVTILIPSGNELNTYIAETILSKSEKGELINGAIRKLTTIEVEEIVLKNNSKFKKYYKNNFEEAYATLCDYLDAMDAERNGKFSRHLIKDTEMRKVLDITLKISDNRFAKLANKINGQDILIIDDTISRGQTIKEACKIMSESYAPKSITVLTLLSKLD